MKKYLLSIIFFIAAVTIYYIAPESGLQYAMLIGTAAGGAGVAFQFQLTYLPEFIQWNAGANQITFLRVETQERGVICDLLAAQIVPVNGLLNVGAMAANTSKVILADGHIKNQNVTISGTTTAAGAVNFFGYSDNAGVVNFRYKNVNLIALNETEFSKFSVLFLHTTVTVNDRIQVFYNDGHQQIYDAVELAQMSAQYTQVAVQAVNNLASNIDKVSVMSAAGGAAIVMSVDLV